MSRNAALAATVSLTLLALAVPALSQTAPAARAPADAATRAGYDRADALSRSVFWTQEQQLNPMDPVAGVKLAQALRELGQFDQAAETAQGVLVVQPANVEAALRQTLSDDGYTRIGAIDRNGPRLAVEATNPEGEAVTLELTAKGELMRETAR